MPRSVQTYMCLSTPVARGAVAAWIGMAATAVGLGPADAAEGMWLLSAPPVDRIEREHGIRITDEWLRRLQGASVRFSTGGSGAFVSDAGLVLTNHHVGADAIAKLGDATHDYLRDGFVASTPADELRCHDLELNVLVSIEDVTARVLAAVGAGVPADEALAARRAVLAAIEQESLAATGLRSDVVTLWQGGGYHLYRSKRYTDVRLVFAPEQQIAFFGGDADNFEFPRYNLDICVFRAYEDGRPARVEHHLTWAAEPPRQGEVVFVFGHPGHTDRGATVAELESLRDQRLPLDLRILHRLESLLNAFSARGPEERRQATHDLRGVENGRKARSGILAGLLDPRVMDAKRRAEERLRAELEPTVLGRVSPFTRIAAAQRRLDGIAERHRLLEAGAGFNSEFFRTARLLLRGATEQTKPNGERLREYRDSNRASLELQLFSEEPLYDALETAKLADSLTFLASSLGADDPLVVRVLDGLPPAERAARLVAATELGRRPPGSPRRDTRRELADGGPRAVAASHDPMLALAACIDEESRRLRAVAEAADEEKKQAHEELTRARFAREGTGLYPDATFTLRLSYGVVTGGTQAGSAYPAVTTMAGLFARATEKRETPPFDLPPRWQTARTRLADDRQFLNTPFNFASTADIIGGNSGSPVVNAAGELVGVIFDGNIDSLILAVVYDDERARAVAVAADAIRVALERVYPEAAALRKELLTRTPRDR